MTASRLVRDDRGIATSLIETVVVIAIIAVISSVALVSAMDRIEDAKLSRATADVEVIGIAIHSFMQANGFAPVFKTGDARSPSDPIFRLLETAGNDPAADSVLHWPLGSADRDRLENHLVKNQPGGSGPRYPRIGEISYARFKGWNGPYLARVPSSDPWDNKYLINTQLLTPKGVQMASETLTVGLGQRTAVFVISAGPNRKLDTRFDQLADTFVGSGDDVIFRIQ